VDVPTLFLSLGWTAPVFIAWLNRARIQRSLAPALPSPDAPAALLEHVRQAVRQAEEAARTVRKAQPLSVQQLSRQAAQMAAAELCGPGGELERRFEVLKHDLRSFTPAPVASDETKALARVDAWGAHLKGEIQTLRAETARLAEERAEAVARKSVSDLAGRIERMDEELGESRVEQARDLGRVEGALLPSPAEGYPPAPRRRR